MELPLGSELHRSSVNEARLADDLAKLVDLLVAAAAGRRPADIRRVLNSAADSVGLACCIDGVLMPAIRRLGQSGADTDSVLSVNLAVETARAWVEDLAARAPEPDPLAPIVLTGGPGERHTLGLEALSMLLRHRRQPCRLLGARVSSGRVSVAVEVNRPAGVVLVAQRDAGHRSCVELLHALAGSGVAIFYAGAAFDTPHARRGVPGMFLGGSFERARALITGRLADEPTAPPLWSE
jgi:hypothetical protein